MIKNLKNFHLKNATSIKKIYFHEHLYNNNARQILDNQYQELYIQTHKMTLIFKLVKENQFHQRKSF